MQGEGYTRIPLHRRDGSVRAYALVDDQDAHLAQLRWSFINCGYAVRYVHPRTEGSQRTVLLHRVILGLESGDGTQVDHKNGDRLDCRRANLRVGTHALNAQNVPPRTGVSSVYRGVCWASGKWRATAVLNGQQHHLGRFEDEHEAGAVAAAFRAQHMPFANEERAA